VAPRIFDFSLDPVSQRLRSTAPTRSRIGKTITGASTDRHPAQTRPEIADEAARPESRWF
jgi:hypothetical protein